MQFRVCRYFLGVGIKYTPTAAVSGDMGWTQPEHRQWLCVIRHWCRLLNLENNNVDKEGICRMSRASTAGMQNMAVTTTLSRNQDRLFTDMNEVNL